MTKHLFKITLSLIILVSCSNTEKYEIKTTMTPAELETVTPQIIKSSWPLIWQDEFNGQEIDTKKWKKSPEWIRQKGVCQWSDKDSYTDKKGNLVLRMRRGKDRIRCGSISTRTTFEKKFGYFETRCKVPSINGGRSAFWLQHKNDKDGTEIDIFESIRANLGRGQHALHWDAHIKGKKRKSAGKMLKNMHHLYDGKFHTFAVLWTPTSYKFYIDGKLTWHTNDGGVSQVKTFIYLTMEAASWSGDISKETLPKYFVIDYVRVYDLPK